ncbi:MAG: SPOR domain-containing protein [Spirochaetota bacterium]
MEQKKLLWILFSATLFLLVVVGAGIIWLYPQPEEQPAVATEETESREAGADFDPIEWVRSDQKTPGLERRPEAEEDENFVVVYGENGESEADEPTISTEDIDGPTDESAGAERSAAADESGAAAEAQEVSAEKPRSTAAQRQKEPEPAQAPAEQPKPQTRTVRTTEYWIQAGSFTSRSRADKIKRELDQLGFTGRIMSQDVDGTLYYRVRIGPYRAKDEAQKFLSWVKEKEQFSGSYISQVYRNKTVVQ